MYFIISYLISCNEISFHCIIQWRNVAACNCFFSFLGAFHTVKRKSSRGATVGPFFCLWILISDMKWLTSNILLSLTVSPWLYQYWPPMPYQFHLILPFFPPLERKHGIFSQAMFKYHSQGCGWEAVWELLSYFPSLSLFHSHSLSGLYSEEYQSSASDIPSITVIPRELSNSYIVRQTLLDTVTKTFWHVLSYWVYLRWNTTLLF